MLVILIETIGFNVNEHFNLVQIKSSSGLYLDRSLGVLLQLFEVLTTIKTETTTPIQEIPFIEFIRNLLKSVIALTKFPNENCYQIFLRAIQIDPLIIEPMITEILIYIMLNDNSKNAKQYETLMIKIFEVFSKLHRIQNLISKMIPTLKSGFENRQLGDGIYKFRGENNDFILNKTDYNASNMLPESVLNYFTNCVTTLASWQVMNLFKTLLHHLDQSVEGLPKNGR